jgi:predicted Rossmann fold nucleotide-binding protein DprA/Smf involved in DNA uptake
MLAMNTTQIHQADAGYPAVLQKYLGDRSPVYITILGNPNILRRKTLALFCSVKCPGKLILQTYDLMQNLRQAGVPVIGGFHSPMEKECLTILLRGSQPVIVCPARSITKMRLRSEYKKPLEEGRLLLLSPFAEKERRATIQMALYRNQVVAALADSIFVAYAEPFSKTETFCREILAWRKPLYTLNSRSNANLIALGAKPVSPNNLSEWT